MIVLVPEAEPPVHIHAKVAPLSILNSPEVDVEKYHGTAPGVEEVILTLDKPTNLSLKTNHVTVLIPSFFTVISNLRDLPTSIFSVRIFFTTLISYNFGSHLRSGIHAAAHGEGVICPALGPVPGHGSGALTGLKGPSAAFSAQPPALFFGAHAPLLFHWFCGMLLPLLLFQEIALILPFSSHSNRFAAGLVNCQKFAPELVLVAGSILVI